MIYNNYSGNFGLFDSKFSSDHVCYLFLRYICLSVSPPIRSCFSRSVTATVVILVSFDSGFSAYYTRYLFPPLHFSVCLWPFVQPQLTIYFSYSGDLGVIRVTISYWWFPLLFFFFLTKFFYFFRSRVCTQACYNGSFWLLNRWYFWLRGWGRIAPTNAQVSTKSQTIVAAKKCLRIVLTLPF